MTGTTRISGGTAPVGECGSSVEKANIGQTRLVRASRRWLRLCGIWRTKDMKYRCETCAGTGATDYAWLALEQCSRCEGTGKIFAFSLADCTKSELYEHLKKTNHDEDAQRILRARFIFGAGALNNRTLLSELGNLEQCNWHDGRVAADPEHVNPYSSRRD